MEQETEVLNHDAGQLKELSKEYILPGEALSRRIQFLLWAPPDPNVNPSTTTLPLVLFLHGSSARGDSLATVREFALPKLLISESHVSKLPMYCVCPLCPKGTEWKDPVMCSLLIALMNDIRDSLGNVDQSKVYCTGVSMGGLGTWMLGARNPRRFAALAPICGGGQTVYARILAAIPIYFFHSEDDNVVGVEETDRLVEALRKENAVEVRYTRYTNSPDPAAKKWMVGHNCWDKAYSDPEFWAWLFSKQIPS